MDCVVCESPLRGSAVRIDQYNCSEHLVHEECMERRGQAWRNPEGGPRRTGFECPYTSCKATSTNYVPSIGGVLDNNLKWIRISKDELNKPAPEKAVSAGQESGMDVFVARGRLRGDLLPGKWIPSMGISQVPWGGQEHLLTECEVLTSKSTECGTLKWIPSKNGEILPNAVLGGYTAYGETLYIGRTVFGSAKDVIPGKVHPSHGVIYLPYFGKELNKSHYELLVYEPVKQPEPEPESESKPEQEEETTESIPYEAAENETLY